jgi:UDP-N-acetylglucosamine--N-acetylmuramyl-(pentapeptide) pyrophosphoryl-undecaprenol N-acetylglucosamine transferase
MRIVFTGGHHTSALPVLKILADHTDIQVVWYGHKHSLKHDKNTTLEYIDITSLGIPFFELKAGKFYKTYDPIRLAKIPYGFFQALYLLIKHKPDLIMSFGGYLALPVVLAGYILGIPSITHEQTVVSGFANKLIARFAKRILITWPSSAKYFPKDKTVLTGIPIRSEIFKVTSSNFAVNKDLPTLYITGGKTGSHKINTVFGDLMGDLLDKVNIIHQCGDYSQTGDFEKLTEQYNRIKHTHSGLYILRKFVLQDEIGEAFGKADIVVARAGAHIVYDLAALNKPCILIPIPWVSHNEQYKNALVLKEAGIAEILSEDKLTHKTLQACIEDMLSNLVNYRSAHAQTLVKSNADKAIVDEIFKFKV